MYYCIPWPFYFLSYNYFVFFFKLCCHSFFFCLFAFLGLHLRHMEVPKLGVVSELQLPAYATSTAMQDTSCVCGPHLRSWQHQILNPLSKARDQTRNLKIPSRIRFHCAMKGMPLLSFLRNLFNVFE